MPLERIAGKQVHIADDLERRLRELGRWDAMLKAAEQLLGRTDVQELRYEQSQRFEFRTGDATLGDIFVIERDFMMWSIRPEKLQGGD